jgi:ABC-type phosphate transport system substrate-binding protein
MKRSLLISMILAAAATPAAPPFTVVVNDANPISSLSEDEVSDLFLKKTSRWKDGSLVLPVDQGEDSHVRERFNHEVHRKSAAAVRAYWQQRIFSGRDVPPPEKRGDAEVIAFVRNNAAAIGYVSATAPVSGVKVVTVRQ